MREENQLEMEENDFLKFRNCSLFQNSVIIEPSPIKFQCGGFGLSRISNFKKNAGGLNLMDSLGSDGNDILSTISQQFF